MIGAKVDMDKARKEKLRFNCGKAGHQAKYCRNKKPVKREAPTKIGMMSYGLVNPGQRKLQYVPIPENSDMFDFESDLEENYVQALQEELASYDNYANQQIWNEMEKELPAATVDWEKTEETLKIRKLPSLVMTIRSKIVQPCNRHRR